MVENACTHRRVARKSKTSKVAVRTEGVWIACQGSKGGADWGVATSENASDDEDENGEEEGAEEDEDDEMIWWAWDGKIVGFSDW